MIISVITKMVVTNWTNKNNGFQKFQKKLIELMKIKLNEPLIYMGLSLRLEKEE
jgi:hypothetical protein